LRLRDICYRIYWKFEQFIVPGLQNSQYLYKQILESHVPQGGRWLELGCGHQVLPDWIHSSRELAASLVSRTKQAVGLDPVFASIRNHKTIHERVVAAIEHSPFRERSFDLVTANMVMEHVQHPAEAVSEANRLLAPGGIFIFHTPNFNNYQFKMAALVPQFLKNKIVWLLEGRAEEDVFPTVYAINTAQQVEQFATQCGFRVVELKMVNSTAITAVFFPLAIVELIAIRLLQSESKKNYRSNIIAILQKA
jgi:ubiquinone/menaquinone biosynthesis C-methylase UbiE